jgi:uncharacterized phiE125 gp8 family phage protein
MRPHYSIITQPTREPVTFDECADHLRIDTVEDVELVSQLISVAREIIDGLTGRASMRAEYKMTAASWRTAQGKSWEYGTQCPIPIYRTPLVSVESVKYYDRENTLQTMSADDYFVIDSQEPGMIQITGDIPAIFDRPDAIQIEFTAGASQPKDVSPIHRHVIKMMVHHLYEQREFINVGNIVTKMPLTMNMMVEQIKVGGWTA